MSEGTEAAAGRLERGEKYFSKDMALALAVLLVTHVFAHAHIRRTVLRKFLIVGENYCGRNVYEIANRRVKFLADISGYTVVLTTLRPQNFHGSSQPRKHFNN